MHRMRGASVSDEDHRRRFESLALPHLDAAYNLARWLTRNDHDAQDVVQEACLRAMRYFGSFRGEQARPWLLQIVRHTCYAWLRENRPVEVEALGAQDGRLRAEGDALRRLRDAVRVHGECHAAPEALRERIERLAGEGDRRTGPSTGSGRTEGALAGWFAWRPFALSFALVALLAAGLGVALWSTFADERLMQEAVPS